MIREGDFRDFKEMLELERQGFPREHVYSPYYLRYLLKKPNSIVLKVLAEQKMVGFIISLLSQATHEAHIINLTVHPSFRRRGYGKLLIQSTEERAKKKEMLSCYLEVRINNESAINLYKKTGYKIEGVVKDYYTYPLLESRDAYKMRKRL
jgi:ribosomal-protein-alanine N-acetyltransferase